MVSKGITLFFCYLFKRTNGLKYSTPKNDRLLLFLTFDLYKLNIQPNKRLLFAHLFQINDWKSTRKHTHNQMLKQAYCRAAQEASRFSLDSRKEWVFEWLLLWQACCDGITHSAEQIGPWVPSWSQGFVYSPGAGGPRDGLLPAWVYPDKCSAWLRNALPPALMQRTWLPRSRAHTHTHTHTKAHRWTQAHRRAHTHA